MTRRERIVAVARANPDLEIALLAERFGMSRSAIETILGTAGIKRQHDYFSARANGVRKSKRGRTTESTKER